jgi:hypothetical protein
MRIRITSNGNRIETTLGRWLEILRGSVRSDAEFAAVLECMLDEHRIRFLPDEQLAA